MQNRKHYIIDGNNVIGKDGFLSKIQRTDKLNARKELARMIADFLQQNKINISLHFDGHPDNSVKMHGVKINYSYTKEADYFIKKEIDGLKNKNDVIVVTSDGSVAQYARVSGCQVQKSEVFLQEIKKKEKTDKEEEIIKTLSDNSEFYKLFNVPHNK